MSRFLRSIKRYIITAQNYHLTSLGNMTRSGIITLGIRKHWDGKKYQRSIGRARVHRKIKIMVTEVENRCMLAKPARQLDLTSIITILLEGILARMKTKESIIECAPLNCQSVVSKTADLHHDLIQNNFTSLPQLKLGLDSMMM